MVIGEKEYETRCWNTRFRGTAAWKNLALRLAKEATAVIDNAHWEVRYGSGDLRNTIFEVEQLAARESTQPPNGGDEVPLPAREVNERKK